MGFSIASAAVSAALAVQTIAAVPPVPLKPQGPWNVQYADNMCLLSRSFGTGDQSVLLGFQPGFGDWRIILTRSAAQKEMTYGEAEISLDGGTPSFKARYFENSLKDGKTRAALIDLDEDTAIPLGGASKINIRIGSFATSLALSAASKALKAINTCEKDLLVHWGMDRAAAESVATFPEPVDRVPSFFRSNDYPESALKRDAQGTVSVRFWVNLEGRARDCAIVQSSGSQDLDSRTCAVIEKRGRFEPARTTTGQQLESIGFARVAWVLPDG